MAEQWVPHSAQSPLPPYAIQGGHDSDGAPIYVGRSLHEDEVLPAKVIPSKNCAYVPWGGQEHAKYQYELLIGPGYAWVPSQHGGVPDGAVATGVSADGEPLFVGRGPHAGSLVVGKVHATHGCLYIPYGGQEVRLSNYEVLIREQVDIWQPTSLDAEPPNAVMGGHDSDGTTIYVARAFHNGIMLPAKFVPDRGEAYIACDGSEIHKENIEVLVGNNNYSWIRTNPHAVHPKAVQSGRSVNGDPLFVGRGYHNGSLTPGLLSFERDYVLIPYGGREISVGDYEVLIRN